MSRPQTKRLSSERIHTKAIWYLGRLKTRPYLIDRKCLEIRDINWDADNKWNCPIVHTEFGEIGQIVFNRLGKHISTTAPKGMWQQMMNNQQAKHA